MAKNNEINRIKKIIVPLLKRNDVVQAGIFGSYAHGKQKKRSDVDILIQYNKSKSLFDLVRLETELEKKLKKKVDLLTYKSIHPLIKERVLNEEVRIL
ncbi:nucleotidyltransferase domain-containing protein [Candidatus Woesearchaeota archaeon]|nr:nucleotidyltransferase domain-containing protein [Candidatus Woesearchaeota archaeon]